MKRTTSAAFAALAVVATALVAAATDVTTCGQTVAAKDTGALVADLTCPSSATGVFLQDRATLDLGGHTLAGGQVTCVLSCTIRNGTIANVNPVGSFGGTAVFAGESFSSRSKFVATDLTVRDSGAGIATQVRRLVLTNVNVSNNLSFGIFTVAAKTLRGTNVTANDNGGTGISFGNSPNGAALRMTGLTATGNGQGGLINNGRRTVLINSTLTGNHFGPFPGDPTLVDIATTAGNCPKLQNTVCDHSFSTPPCHVCSGD
jgi:Right handed beta helix region